MFSCVSTPYIKFVPPQKFAEKKCQEKKKKNETKSKSMVEIWKCLLGPTAILSKNIIWAPLKLQGTPKIREPVDHKVPNIGTPLYNLIIRAPLYL
jgi:hypothetical protein